MGKKRSKTSKKKQAKAAAAAGARVGKLLLRSDRKRRSQLSSSAAPSYSQGAKAATKKQTTPKRRTESFAASSLDNQLFGDRRKVFMSPVVGGTRRPPQRHGGGGRGGNGGGGGGGDDEDREYRRQMSSMRERLRSRDAKKAEIAAAKKYRGALTGFQPATFSTGPRSTLDLLEETTDRLRSAMTAPGAGSAVTSERPSTPVRTNRSWDVDPSPATVRTDEDGVGAWTATDNRFGALAEGDEDSDDGWGVTKKKKKMPSTAINFAPPSFSLLPRITPTPATTPLRPSSASEDDGAARGGMDGELYVDGIDPDL